MVTIIFEPFILNVSIKENVAHELDPKELVDFRKMVMVNTIQVDTMYQLLIQKVYFTDAEFFEKMKEIQADYQKVGWQ